MRYFAAFFVIVSLFMQSRPAVAQIPAQPPVIAAENIFAIDLYQNLQNGKGNFLFSPYSVATSVGMIYAGAGGSTAADIVRMLHIAMITGNDQSEPSIYLSDLKKTSLFAPQQPDDFVFNAANAVWVAENTKLKPDYTFKIANIFGGAVNRVDFDDAPAAALEINQWISTQTKNKIQNVISPDALSPPPRLILTNAVYFKASWLSPFDKFITQKEVFHVAQNREVMSQMMMKSQDYALAQMDDVEILTLPYNGDASMIVVLPDKIDGLNKIEESLTSAELNRWIANSRSTLVFVSLPKFQSTSSFDLRSALMSLGMKAAFNPQEANLTGISDSPSTPLYIGDVIHKAFIGVDESGTEAAATTVTFAYAAGYDPNAPRPVPFNADHPFMYLIRANSSGAILFMGRVTDPTIINQ